jgi:hypothetical protein
MARPNILTESDYNQCYLVWQERYIEEIFFSCRLIRIDRGHES